MILNSIALSGLVYVGSVLDIPEQIVKEINRLVFSFLWSNKNELVARTTLFQPITNGGLGLTDIRTKIHALHLNNLSRIVDPNYRASWVYLARYFIGRSLAKYSEQVSFLRSNLVPHSITRPPYYDCFLSLIDKHKLMFKTLMSQSTSVRKIYSALQEATHTRPIAEPAWEASLSKSFPWKLCWLVSLTGISSGSENDVSWKILHRVLKTSSYLKSWGLRISDQCDACCGIEDLYHLFLHCPIAKAVWSHFSSPLSSLLGSFSLNPSTVFFHQFPIYLPKYCKMLVNYLLKLIKYFLWTVRCKRKFEKFPSNPNHIIFAITFEIKDRIRIAHMSNGKLNDQMKLFSYNNVLCEIVGNNKLLLKL